MGAGEASTSDPLAEIRAEMLRSGYGCTTRLFIERMAPADQAAISQALAEGIPASAVVRFLTKRGFTGNEGPAVRHLRGRCTCQTH